jgi:hypothetical protein
LLLHWRRSYGFGWLESTVLALYCAVLALVIPAHEPWSDEAQAWLLARENTAWQMIRYRLHYEGAPPLWHILLRLFHLAHGTYAGVGWFGAAFSVAGVYVLLRWSPFPLIVRALLPFTFFLQYQYAVIARSYNLFPLLVFSMCALYPRKQKIVWFALVAGLLANISLQGIECASIFSVLYLMDFYHARRRGFAVPRRQLGLAVAIFAVLAGVACYAAAPAPDVNFAVTGTTSNGPIHKVLVKLMGEQKPVYAKPPAPGPYIAPQPREPMPRLLSSPAGWAAWQMNRRPQPWIAAAAEFMVSIASQAAWPVATSNLLAVSFLGLLFAWLWVRKSLRMLLPWLSLMVVGQILWVADHHVGMIFVAMLSAIWIGAERSARPLKRTRLNVAFTLVFALVVALQVGWSAVCIGEDLRGNYDPGRETAAFMQQHPVERTAAFNYWATSIQPYFMQNPFFNIPTRYRIWSWNTNPDSYYQEVLATDPDRVIYSAEFPGPGQMRNQWIPLNHVPTAEEERTLPWDQAILYFHTHGYVETHRFCGTRFVRMSSSFTDCDLVLEPAGDTAQ